MEAVNSFLLQYCSVLVMVNGSPSGFLPSDKGLCQEIFLFLYPHSSMST